LIFLFLLGSVCSLAGVLQVLYNIIVVLEARSRDTRLVDKGGKV